MPTKTPALSVRESSVERAFVRWCKKQGYRIVKLGGTRALPDRLVLDTVRGRAWFVELKRPKGGRLSPHQVRMIQDLTDAGLRAAVGKTLKQLQEILNNESAT